jgi:outer membrane protein OmpA-like peptidoglycan-associated protein
MAFNFNKNKSSKTKFDLSKNDTGTKRNPYWMLILLVLVIGGAAWYFAAGRKAESIPVQPDTVNIAKPVIAKMPDAPAPVNHQVAASFDKGSVSATTISDSLVNGIVSSNANIIHVIGYASSEGDSAVNMQISQRRAESFKEYLVSKGVDERRIIATGKGIENPIASNSAEFGRQKNRRVEVVIE